MNREQQRSLTSAQGNLQVLETVEWPRMMNQGGCVLCSLALHRSFSCVSASVCFFLQPHALNKMPLAEARVDGVSQVQYNFIVPDL
ncbi:mCG1030034, isoform CRA_a [Mus musculus]|nr:mCG1030034, isoform CRA_a [Mus musculus]EDL07986.1 mCG1030034, isoform CRA_a [Mus musculus]